MALGWPAGCAQNVIPGVVGDVRPAIHYKKGPKGDRIVISDTSICFMKSSSISGKIGAHSKAMRWAAGPERAVRLWVTARGPGGCSLELGRSLGGRVLLAVRAHLQPDLVDLRILGLHTRRLQHAGYVYVRARSN